MVPSKLDPPRLSRPRGLLHTVPAAALSLSLSPLNIMYARFYISSRLL